MYSTRLGAAQALALTEQGATILLLDVPEGTAIGIDQKTFVVGPKFLGVKMVPPGAHLVACNAASRDGSSDFGPTASFFVHLPLRAACVRRWSPSEEVLLPLPEEEEARYVGGIRSLTFDAGLAPYDLASAAAWAALTSCLSPAVAARLSPAHGASLCVTAEPDPAAGAGPTAAEQRLEAQLAGRGTGEQRAAGGGAGPGVEQVARTGVGRCFYTKVPRHVQAPGAVGRQLTALNLDKSAALEALLQQPPFREEPEALLGELQFAFLAFMLGQSLEGYGQWKALLRLLLACRAGPLAPPLQPFFSRFTSAFACQLALALPLPGAGGEGPAPLGLPMTEELLADSFLRHLVEGYCAALTPPAAPAPLLAAVAELRGLVQSRLGWARAPPRAAKGRGAAAPADEEEDDEAPTIADASELGYG